MLAVCYLYMCFEEIIVVELAVDVVFVPVVCVKGRLYAVAML